MRDVNPCRQLACVKAQKKLRNKKKREREKEKKARAKLPPPKVHDFTDKVPVPDEYWRRSVSPSKSLCVCFIYGI